MMAPGGARGHGVDPARLHAWLIGRSLARELPAPVADRGGFRIDTRSESEYCRWVFAMAGPSLADLAREITLPQRFIKLCDTDATLRALLPEPWQLHAPSYFMQAGDWRTPPPLPTDYHCQTTVNGAVISASITSDTGTVAAFGFAADTTDAFVYDRIVTAADYRRKGLGTCVMAALHDARQETAAPELLVATEDGRHLYERIGWRVLAPYATASIPAA